MLLEWLRREMPKFDEELKTYLFTTKPITSIEEDEEGEGEGDGDSGAGDLGIGKK
jgi:hypothetical protein